MVSVVISDSFFNAWLQGLHLYLANGIVDSGEVLLRKTGSFIGTEIGVISPVLNIQDTHVSCELCIV